VALGNQESEPILPNSLKWTLPLLFRWRFATCSYEHFLKMNVTPEAIRELLDATGGVEGMLAGEKA
jgi:hypothetical protein